MVHNTGKHLRCRACRVALCGLWPYILSHSRQPPFSCQFTFGLASKRTHIKTHRPQIPEHESRAVSLSKNTIRLCSRFDSIKTFRVFLHRNICRNTQHRLAVVHNFCKFVNFRLCGVRDLRNVARVAVIIFFYHL